MSFNSKKGNYSIDDLGLEMEVAEPIESVTPISEEVTTSESAYNQQEIFALAKASLDFLGALAIPDTMKYLFPFILHRVWEWLVTHAHKEKDFSRLVLGLPRGFAKTTLIKLFILYCILFTKKKFILILTANANLSYNIIADVCDMLDESNIVKVFGNWRIGIEKDTQGLKKFGFRGRNIILAGLGQGGSVRGLNLKNDRPDVMIFDDVQTKEDAESELTSKGIESWMFGTAMKAKSPEGCLYIFVANMYPTKWSILRRLKANPTWLKFIVGGILADGTSLWEELHPIKTLLEEYESDKASGHAEIFHSEVLNDENASVNTHIDISKIPPYPFGENEISSGSFIIIDPSNDKSNSDAVSIGLFQIYDSLPTLTVLKEGRFSPYETIREALAICFEHGCSLVVIESNAYQYSLNYWFAFVCEQIGCTGIQAVPIYSGQRSKNSRILDMFKSLTGDKATILIHPRTRPLVFSQITGFNPLKTNNIDGILDLLTYAPRAIEEFASEIAAGSFLTAASEDSIGVPSVEETSCF